MRRVICFLTITLKQTNFRYFLFFVFASLYALSLLGQKARFIDAPLTNDITKVLKNGFTYSLRENSQNDEGLYFIFVVKCGYLNENKKETHLSHVIEHMAFSDKSVFGEPNKTKLVDMGLISSLDFGGSTHYDHTSYRIYLPVVDNQNIRTLFRIIRSWSSDMSLDSATIEIDRKSVINELKEFETGRVNKLTYKASFDPRLIRNVTSDRHAVENFKQESIVSLYQRMYRPDLQGLIVVGDLKKVPELESIIHSTFGSIPTRNTKLPAIVKTNLKPGINWSFIDHSHNSYISLQKELRLETVPVKSKKDLKSVLERELLSVIANWRFQKLKLLYPEVVECEYEYRQRAYLSEAGMDVFGGRIVVQDSVNGNKVDSIMLYFLEQEEHLFRYGPTEAEIKDAKELIQSVYRRKAVQENRSLAEGLENQFIYGDVILSEDYLKDSIRVLLSSVSMSSLCRRLHMFRTSQNLNVFLNGYKGSSGMFKDENLFFKHLNELRVKKNLIIKEAVVKEIPQPVIQIDSLHTGTYSKVTNNGNLSWYRLSNGIQVLLNPLSSTRLPTGKVEVKLFRRRGISNLHPEFRDLGNVVPQLLRNQTEFGLSKSQMDSFVADYDLNIDFTVNDEYSLIEGSSKINGSDWLLKMIVGYLNGLNKSSSPGLNEKGFLKITQSGMVSDSMLRNVFDLKMRNGKSSISLAEYSNEVIQRVVASLFPDRGEYFIVATGDFENEQFLEALAQQFNSLKIGRPERNEMVFNVGRTDTLRVVPKSALKTIVDDRGKESTINLYYYFNQPPGMRGLLQRKILTDLLYNYLFRKVRSEAGAVYGLSTICTHVNDSIFYIYVNLPSRIFDAEKMLSLAQASMHSFLTEGISEYSLKNARQRVLREFNMNRRQNRLWNDYLLTLLRTGENLNEIGRIEYHLESISVTDIQNLANQCLIPQYSTTVSK